MTDSRTELGKAHGEEWARTVAARGELEFMHKLASEGDWGPVRFQDTKGSTIPPFISAKNYPTTATVWPDSDPVDSTDPYWGAFVSAASLVDLPPAESDG
jgi:hypothetical protein